MIALLFFLPLLSFASIEAELGAYSDFIWRGVTFTENRPAVQLELESESQDGWYVGSFFSNAEFSDDALHKHAKVTSEADVILGKRWYKDDWTIQTYYSKFFFPNAGVFDTDEWNAQVLWKSWSLEFSYMDDYFGYHTRATYLRSGYKWIYKEDLEGSISLGLNSFTRTKGNIRTRGSFETLDGAGNSDYIDIYFSNKKMLGKETYAEFGLNWTNRKEYTVDSGEISSARARDFAIVIAYVIPFVL